MKRFPIRIGLCGVLAFAAGAVWAQQQLPAIKPATSPPDAAKSAPVAVHPPAILGKPFPFVPQQIASARPDTALGMQPIFHWSGDDQRDICAIEALINRTINLGNFGINTKKVADVLDGGVPKAAAKAKAEQAKDANATPNILLAGGETIQLAQAGKEIPPASPESKQLTDEINRALKMQADMLRSMDIGALYRPTLPMIQPCISYIPHGTYPYAFPYGGHPYGAHPFGGFGPGVAAPGVAGPGVVAPGVGPFGGAPFCGPQFGALQVAGVQVGAVALGGLPFGGLPFGGGPVIGNPCCNGTYGPMIVCANGLCYIDGCAMVLTGRTGLELAIMVPPAYDILKLPREQGLYVKEVYAKTPAEAAGYKRGDILIELDGKKVPSSFFEFLNEIFHKVKNNTPIPGVVLRAGQRVEINGLTITDKRVLPPLPHECPLDLVLPDLIQVAPGINSVQPGTVRLRELRTITRPGGITEYIWVDPTTEKK